MTLNPAIDRTVYVANLVQGAVNRARHIGDRAGGKGVNVAAALAEQGVRTAALGFLGQQNDGLFTTLFASAGIVDDCLRLEGETRMGIKIVDPARGETTDLNFPGLAPEPDHLDALTRQLAGVACDWCVLAGSLPAGVPTGFYATVCRSLRERGIRVALDTSGMALKEAVRARPDLLKPNIHELAELIGRELPDQAAIVAAARSLVAEGVGLVAVSCGEDGAVFITADAVVCARPPRIVVRSTVGAGDAMVAGLVAARLRGLPLAEAARLATAFSLHALKRGSRSISPPAAVERFASQVDVCVL